MKTKAVEYRDIPGFPGYRAGSDGSIWSCRIGKKWKLLKARPNSPIRPPRGGSYLYVVLGNEHGPKMKFVHVLVLEAFVGPRPDGYQSCHGDGDPKNNRLDNLRWDTCRANRDDARRHGTLPLGEKKPGAKLTEAAVVEIRRLAAEGVPKHELARRYAVSHTTIVHIVWRKKWKHVP